MIEVGMKLRNRFNLGHRDTPIPSGTECEVTDVILHHGEMWASIRCRWEHPTDGWTRLQAYDFLPLREIGANYEL